MLPATLDGALNALANNPLQQGVLVAVATFILEDPVTFGSGLLVAAGQMSFWTALIGLLIGIVVGDCGLYAMGRYGGKFSLKRGWITPEKLDAGKRVLEGGLWEAILLARLTPGMRLPTYVAAGVLHASPVRFLMAAIAATTIWTLAVLALTIGLGEVVLERFEAHRWKLIIGMILSFIALRTALFYRRKGKTKVNATAPSEQAWSRAEPPIHSLFEFWPPWLFYIPVIGYCLWLSLKLGGKFTLPMAANPNIYAGGLIMESKGDIMNQVQGEEARGYLATYVLVEPASSGDEGPIRAATWRAERKAAEQGIQYPLVAKPDVGQRGAGVKLIRDRAALTQYILAYRSSIPIVLQEYVAWPHEVGVLYYRIPGETRGHIFSITSKEFPSVTGDGKQTLAELIDAHPRARHMRDVYRARHAAILEVPLPANQQFELVFTGNHCQGAVFRNGIDLATDALLTKIEGIARALPRFYFGRFDIRYASKEALMAGREFRIVEINGAGAEATHIWDPSTRLFNAYDTLFQQFHILYTIGAINNERGHTPPGLATLIRDSLHYRQQSAGYPTA